MIPIKRLSHQDLPLLNNYLSQEPEANLFIQGDIETYGLEGSDVALYAVDKPWDSLILRYHSDFIVYSTQRSYNTKAVAAFLSRQEKVSVISGKETLIEQLKPFYPEASFESTLFCRCLASSFQKGKETSVAIKRLQAEDAPSLVALYLQIQEFAQSYRKDVQAKTVQIQESFQQGDIGFGIYEGSRLVAAAQSTATTSQGSMIIGVATHPEYRKKGYASALVEHLCTYHFSAGLKFLCLFFNNPLAGAMYTKFDFEHIGRWAIIRT